MMLVHKQPPPYHQSSLYQHNTSISHRRHPSAPPTLIVQPTHTPGLLSLSKPKPTLQRSQQQKSPRPRLQHPPLLNSVEITDKKTIVRPKNAKLSDSPPSHSKKCQTSLPPLESSQAEDPFLDFSPSTTFKPSTPRPSGKQLLRMPVPALNLQTPSKLVSVPPAHRSTNSQPISRSAPDVSHSWDHICDDSNDEAPFAPPTTPIRSRPNMNASFSGSIPKTPRRKPRNHRRTSSDYIFAMSSDDETASGPEDLHTLLDFIRSGSTRAFATSTPPPLCVDVRSLSPASREKIFELEAQQEVAGYFASSSFQNSPSPDDLPAPLFA